MEANLAWRTRWQPVATYIQYICTIKIKPTNVMTVHNCSDNQWQYNEPSITLICGILTLELFTLSFFVFSKKVIYSLSSKFLLVLHLYGLKFYWQLGIFLLEEACILNLTVCTYFKHSLISLSTLFLWFILEFFFTQVKLSWLIYGDLMIIFQTRNFLHGCDQVYK